MYKNIDWPKYSREKEEYTEIDSLFALKYYIVRDFERINGDITARKLLISLLFEP